jgi:NUMOD3 motif
MNYTKVYQSLILKAQNRNLRHIYIERHHIVPLSLKGEDVESNIVSLTAKEHFVAHHLLWKIHRNREMTKAFMLMCNTKRGGQKFKISAREYQILKEEFSKAQSEAVRSRPGNNLGKTLPQEWRDNISKGQKGISKGKGNPSSFKGKTHSEEAKRKISEKRKGVPTRTGIPFSEETKRMMSINRKGKTKIPWTEERKAARSEMMKELHKKRKEEKSPD